uniref:UDP-glucose 6-dehydrogenase n=1 Tax=Solanum lycopersicum TaxID=4081 RepID=A0A3Q7FLM3_SOLLC
MKKKVQKKINDNKERLEKKKRKMVKICCIGAGYAGGPTMDLIALKCPSIKVVVVDISVPRITAWNSDHLHIYEQGLWYIVRNFFVSVNTPTKSRGLGAGKVVDLTYWESASSMIVDVSKSDKIVVKRSTIPIKTAEAIEGILTHNSNNRINFQILSIPEFLAERTAIEELFKQALKDVYAQWIPQDYIITTNLWSAELSKLTANAFLSQRISFVNAMSALYEASGANASEVSYVVGKDSRIHIPSFLMLLVYICECNGLLEVVEYWKLHGVASMLNTISGKKVAILGFAFKKDISDIRETPAIDVSRDYWETSQRDLATSKFYWDHLLHLHPMSPTGVKQVSYVWDAYSATKDAHVVCILIEWDEFMRIQTHD